MPETLETDMTSIATRSSRNSVRRSVLSNSAVLLFVDLFIGFISYALAWMIRMYVKLPLTQDLLPTERWDSVNHWWLFLLLSQAFFLYVFGFYDDQRRLRLRELVSRLLLAVTAQVIIVTSFFYMANEIYPRSVIALFGLLNGLGLAVWRSAVRAGLRSAVRRVLIVGKDRNSVISMADEIRGSSEATGMLLVGVVCDDGPEAGPAQFEITMLGSLSEIHKIVLRHRIDEVIVVSESTWRDRLLNDLGRIQAERPVSFAILPSVYELAIGRLRHINVRDTPLIEVREKPNEPVERMMKRAFDLALSITLLTILLPFLLVVSLAVMVSSPGPVFYLQDRIGYEGKRFRLIKFRTMIRDAEKSTGEVLAGKNDPRVTPVGAFLRRFRIDEIPQFLNVLKGDMSFVGPRPERPGFVQDFLRKLPGYSERHKIKPGITGLAQVRGYYDTTAETKLKYDLAYIYNQSFSLDMMILLETIKTVLIRPGS